MVTYYPREICHVPSPSALLHHSEGAETQVKNSRRLTSTLLCYHIKFLQESHAIINPISDLRKLKFREPQLINYRSRIPTQIHLLSK